ncbi:hypothetical protein [Methylomonas methanica]|uniref:Uncharacterized protein n=1 Tax=Methylomonas methanica (strain DSM 25384 / MC09) TaxID=857087 RepID=G0A038_METMM|nr:hypothetical protein [Methylomonas methanica]AEG01177.1 hypothetical protein Metme_2795 [Methylomonas methanica MC09]
MNSRIIKWQLIASACLTVILLAEWAIGESQRSHLQTLLDRTIQSEYQAEPMPTLNPPKPFNESMNEIVERPLFIEGRRPLPEQEVEGPETLDNGQLDDWQLIGIYNKGSRKLALFRKQNEAKTFVKRYETEMITSWQLKQIQSDRVVLQQGGQQKSIMLRKPRVAAPVVTPSRRPVVPAKPRAPVAPIYNNSSENTNNDR